MPHLRPLHSLCLHPRSRLLRAPGRLPRSLPPGRKGARLGRRLPSVRRLRRPCSCGHGARNHRPPEHPGRHVLCLKLPAEQKKAPIARCKSYLPVILSQFGKSSSSTKFLINLRSLKLGIFEKKVVTTKKKSVIGILW
jgi:hypothetical protein